MNELTEKDIKINQDIEYHDGWFLDIEVAPDSQEETKQIKQNILKWQEDSKKLEKIVSIFRTRRTPLIAKEEVEKILNEDSEKKQ